MESYEDGDNAAQIIEATTDAMRADGYDYGDVTSALVTVCLQMIIEHEGIRAAQLFLDDLSLELERQAEFAEIGGDDAPQTKSDGTNIIPFPVTRRAG